MWRAHLVVVCLVVPMGACRPVDSGDGPAQLQQAQGMSFGAADGVTGTVDLGEFGYSVAACGSPLQVVVGAPGEPQAYAVFADGGRAGYVMVSQGNPGYAVACGPTGHPIVGNPQFSQVLVTNQQPLQGPNLAGFGSALAVGRNGHNFLAVGAPEAPYSGVWVFSLDDGGLSAEFSTDAGPSSLMGSTVAAGDLNGDNLDDLVVGGNAGSEGSVAPMVWVYLSYDAGVWRSSPVTMALAAVPSALAVGELVSSHAGNELLVGEGSLSRVIIAGYDASYPPGLMVPVATPLDGAPDSGFGTALTIGIFEPGTSEPELFVGAPGLNKVYGYGRNPGMSPPRETFDPPPTVVASSQSAARFGFSLALQQLDTRAGKELVVGAPGWDPRATPTGPTFPPTGAVFFFTSSDGGLGGDGGQGGDGGRLDGGSSVDGGGGGVDGGSKADAGVDGGPDVLPRCTGAGTSCSAKYCETTITGTCVLGFCRPGADPGPLCTDPTQVCDVFTQACIPRPTAAFAATPQIGWAPLEVSFTTTTPNPARAVFTYQWDFGDGSPAVLDGGKQTTHAYQVPGTWLAKLTVDALVFTSLPGTQLIEVKGRPHITSTPPPAAACREEWAYQPTATGVVTSWKLLGQVPPEMTFDSTTGRISWTDATPGDTAVAATLVLTGDELADEQPISLTVNCPASLDFKPCGCSTGAGPLVFAGLAWLLGRRRRA